MFDIEKWQKFGDFVAKNWLGVVIGALVGGGFISGLYEQSLLPSPLSIGAPAQVGELEDRQRAHPRILLMDSADPDLVYDKDTKAAGGSNLDDLNEALESLPLPGLELIAETASPVWSREDQILQLDPDLIIIHLSCFYEESEPLDWDDRLHAFLKYMEVSSAKFLVYSRGVYRDDYPEERLRNWKSWREKLYSMSGNELKDRLSCFDVDGGADASFKNPNTMRRLKMRVKALLDLEQAGDGVYVQTCR